jgi:subtilisin family serine protease
MYRTLDTDGFATDAQVACAMIEAVKDDRQILNLSLGTQTLDNLPPVAMVAALEVIGRLERERKESVVIVAAAGNCVDTTPVFPAAMRRVVSVGGLAPDLLPSTWSTRGFWLTCSAVGQGLRSTYVEGRESSEIDPEPDVFGPDAWAVSIGTSFAAPQITGAIARLSQEEGLAPHRALVRLLAAGRPVPDFGQAIKILPGL